MLRILSLLITSQERSHNIQLIYDCIIFLLRTDSFRFGNRLENQSWTENVKFLQFALGISRNGDKYAKAVLFSEGRKQGRNICRYLGLSRITFVHCFIHSLNHILFQHSTCIDLKISIPHLEISPPLTISREQYRRAF